MQETRQYRNYVDLVARDNNNKHNNGGPGRGPGRDNGNHYGNDKGNGNGNGNRPGNGNGHGNGNSNGNGNGNKPGPYRSLFEEFSTKVLTLDLRRRLRVRPGQLRRSLLRMPRLL